MCKLIAELVGTDKQLLRETINRLEQASGAPAIDIRLTSEIYGKLHMKMRELGLDPNDTTPHELYQALMNLALLHDKFLANRLGITDQHDPKIVLPKVTRFINNMRIPKHAWALKHVAAKRLLKLNPPKTLMKLLHYRSADSMLKRESATLLLTAARHLEPETWQQRVIQSYAKLQPSDFEDREIELVYMSEERWRIVGVECNKQKLHTTIYNPEIACIAFLPLPAHRFEGLTLIATLLGLRYINDCRTFSTYIKFHHMRSDFGKFLANTILQPRSEHARIAGQPLHWRTIHRYYGTARQLDHPEIFEPHLQAEDLAYRKAESILFRLEPALHFWHDIDYVGLPQPIGGPVSFNLCDMAMNLMNHTPFDKRANYHMRDSLWNELFVRYAGQPALERQLLQQLDDQTLSEPIIVRDLEFVW